jgi:hypothetical protein
MEVLIKYKFFFTSLETLLSNHIDQTIVYTYKKLRKNSTNTTASRSPWSTPIHDIPNEETYLHLFITFICYFLSSTALIIYQKLY